MRFKIKLKLCTLIPGNMNEHAIPEKVQYQISLNMLNEYSTILGTAMAWS